MPRFQWLAGLTVFALLLDWMWATAPFPNSPASAFGVLPVPLQPSGIMSTWISPGNSVKSLSPSLLKPGVYKTSPFSGIVIVPGTNLDDKFAVSTTPAVELMPTIKPELNLIPFQPK